MCRVGLYTEQFNAIIPTLYLIVYPYMYILLHFYPYILLHLYSYILLHFSVPFLHKAVLSSAPAHHFFATLYLTRRFEPFAMAV